MSWIDHFVVADSTLPVKVLLRVLLRFTMADWVVIRVEGPENTVQYFIARVSDIQARAGSEIDAARLSLWSIIEGGLQNPAAVVPDSENRPDAGTPLNTHPAVRLNEDGIVTGIFLPDEATALSRRGFATLEPPPNVLNFSIIRVWYVTDRSREESSEDESEFGRGRSKDGTLSYGRCDVAIPRDHKMGHIESPRWWKCEFRQNPQKHIAVVDCVVTTRTEFFETLSAKVQDEDAFVFIHGYNVSFEEGVRRTAQLAYDLGFSGAPILFSWPSQASAHWYVADEATIAWSELHILRFMQELTSATPKGKIHIIAHSMGARALAHVLKYWASLKEVDVIRLGQVVLTAPDIDAGEFAEIAAGFKKNDMDRITLYASSHDRALLASKLVHKAPRAGEAGDNILIIDGLDTIDASSVDTSFIGHSYFGERRSVMSDMYYLVRHSLPPMQRHGLLGQLRENLLYWVFQP